MLVDECKSNRNDAGYGDLKKTKEMYRALIEATVCGTRIIIDTFEEGGLTIDKLCTCGGIAIKTIKKCNLCRRY